MHRRKMNCSPALQVACRRTHQKAELSPLLADLERVTTPVIDALQEDLPISKKHRRLVLVSAPEPVSSHDHVEPTGVDSPADSPSDSGGSASVTEAVSEVFEAAGRFELDRRFVQTGLEYLDSVDLHIVFRTRAVVMKSIPFLLKVAFRALLICALREVVDGNNQGNELRGERGWKMLMLLPRCCWQDPEAAKSRRRSYRNARFVRFRSVAVVAVVRAECARAAVASKVRASRRPRQDDIQSRVQRAEALVQMGELSALAHLTNPARRPPTPQDQLSGSGTAVLPQYHSSWTQSCFARMCILHEGTLHQVHLA